MNKKLILLFFTFSLFNQIFYLNADDDTYINSNNIIYNEKENTVELAQNSKININNTNILIDRGIIDYNNDTLEVFGNFYLYQDLNILSGNNLKGDTKLINFNATDVSYVYNNDLKIDSERIQRQNNFVYFDDNFLTPCEIDGYFNCPTWSLRIDKTRYNIENDQFVHYDSFLQIADYKVFYLPYFSHYGSKAPRKRGFLTPTLEFAIGTNQSLRTPYYIPLNVSTDILVTPKLYFSQNFDFLEDYELNTKIQNRNTGGKINFEINSVKYKNNSNVNNTIRINTKQVIDKNKILSASGLFTNSISTTRSDNEEPITFENLYLKVENYNFLEKNDYLRIELRTVEAFDSSSSNSIPIIPSIFYSNQFEYGDKIISNEFDLITIRRDDSSSSNPSESIKYNMLNEINLPSFYRDFYTYNKIIAINSINDYYFNKNKTLNNSSYKSNIILSSDFYLNNSYRSKPRLKFILPVELTNKEKKINEDSVSLSFNYQNQYSENRFFGNDLVENSPRVVYGLENYFNIYNQELSLKFNQSYDIKTNNRLTSKINQSSKLSDFAVEAKTKIKDISLQIDTRLNESDLSKKEMNYNLNLNNILNINYHETQSEAFKDLSNDTQVLDFGISKEINKNMIFFYNTSLDVKNNYDPYKSSINLKLFDECSQLYIKYSNTRFNDNFNTKPEETISISFYMDYLGFFGYQQSTNVFFEEAGTFNYGL